MALMNFHENYFEVLKIEVKREKLSKIEIFQKFSAETCVFSC